jgi:hypothetical protein
VSVPQLPLPSPPSSGDCRSRSISVSSAATTDVLFPVAHRSIGFWCTQQRCIIRLALTPCGNESTSISAGLRSRWRPASTFAVPFISLVDRSLVTSPRAFVQATHRHALFDSCRRCR